MNNAPRRPKAQTSLQHIEGVEQKSRADFAPDTELPLSKLTATDNIMLWNHGQ